MFPQAPSTGDVKKETAGTTLEATADAAPSEGSHVSTEVRRERAFQEAVPYRGSDRGLSSSGPRTERVRELRRVVWVKSRCWWGSWEAQLRLAKGEQR